MNQDTINKLPPVLQKNLDKNLCVCNDVPKIDIINAITNGACTLEQVKAKTYASEGNECCKQQIERLIECLVAKENK
ncbi:MAG: (2Fe-2S)-binding protein [Thiomicrorhabdus sp.]|nr:(2Fe-2S)-binding protein [Thiomicrorhabdus sp.]